jgi:hypothetical protein
MRSNFSPARQQQNIIAPSIANTVPVAPLVFVRKHDRQGTGIREIFHSTAMGICCDTKNLFGCGSQIQVDSRRSQLLKLLDAKLILTPKPT